MEQKKNEEPREKQGNLTEEALQSLLDEHSERTLAKVNEAIAAVKRADTPDRSTLAAISDDSGTAERRPAGSVRVTPATQFLYDRMPPQKRKYRSPEMDEHVKDWVLATVRGDHEAITRIMRKDEDLFGGMGGERTLYTTTTQAEFIPVPFAANIVLERDKVAKMRRLASIFTSPNTSIGVPTSPVAGASMEAEGATADDDEPTTSSVTLTKKKAQARMRANIEVIEDSAYNIASFFAERAGSALGALEDAQFATGTGTPPQTNSLDSASITDVGVDAVTAESPSPIETITYADLVTLFFALPEQYRSMATFVASSTTLGYINAIISTTGAAVLSGILNPPRVVTDDASGGGVVGFLFGRPVVDLPVDNGGLYFGDLNHFGILDGGGITVRVSEHVGWTTDHIDWKFTERFDGAVITTGAFRKLTGITGGSASS